jgi:acyl carrier protein
MNAVEEVICRFITHEIWNDSSRIALSPGCLLLEQGMLDSLGLQKLVIFLENEFSIVIEGESLIPENFESVRALARLVEEIRK